LIRVHGALVIDKDCQLDTISVGCAHGTDVKSHIIPVDTGFFAFDKFVYPVGDGFIELFSTLDLIVGILGSIAFVGFALITADRLLGEIAMLLLQFTATYVVK
jgi:hypothetical protein